MRGSTANSDMMSKRESFDGRGNDLFDLENSYRKDAPKTSKSMKQFRKFLRSTNYELVRVAVLSASIFESIWVMLKLDNVTTTTFGNV